tara:strand:+ start:1157 stop:1531 length:375 start_codon:yes stop_codon:yes gene_type:complete
MEDCIFCNLENSRIENESELFISIKDMYPVTKGHTLIVSKRHVASYFDLSADEKSDLITFLDFERDKILRDDNSIDGFNVGINDGQYAGQTIMHFHMHLIPRRKGDVKEPTGGVRGVIPNKQKY